MRLTTALGPWTAAFFTSLGLSPLVACGGTSVDRTGSNDPGAGGGGRNAGGGGGNAGGGGDSVAGGSAGTGGRGNGGHPGGGDGGYSFGGAGGSFGGRPGGDGGTIGAGGAYFRKCVNPTPHLGADGKPTGFVDCAGGSMHRAEKHDCASRVPRTEKCPNAPTYDAGPMPYGCQTDAECSSQLHGYCRASQGGGLAPGCYCSTGCVNDAECGTGQICLCGDPVGQCVTASCTTNGDCPGDALCLTSTSACPGIQFACQTDSDDCAGDADCQTGSQCSIVGGAHRCQFVRCVTGRPFLVGGAARIAGAVRRKDWTSELAPCLDGLDGAARAALASRWTEIALMEHASIAAFARFALEILSLGAPPELLVATHAAMADETVHARDAFALASAYAGKPLGPGNLDIGAALGARTPLDIVRTAILEGCIGETVAAVEAAEALAHATDPAVREALARVTVDETRHAELAWRFVQWVLEHGDPALRTETATVLVGIVGSEAAACPAITEERALPSTATLRAHGFVSEATRNDIRRRVLGEVVLPCARALVSASYFALSGELMKNSTELFLRRTL
jgi:hypothetical protein